MNYTETNYKELQTLYLQVKHLSNLLSIPFADAAQLVMLYISLGLIPKTELPSEHPSTEA